VTVKVEVPRPIFVPPHVGTVLDSLSVTHKLVSHQTCGAYYCFTSEFEPGAGNRLHVHSRDDEFGFVLEGALEIRLRDETRVLEVGGAAHLPRTIPHAIRNPLETTSRYLFMAIPGGMDELFDAVEAARRAGTLDDATFRALSLEHGIEWLE
jgi:uncharacterized cupin superfamily protein